ncbi:MAG: hypothetical protein KGH49_04055 [Candidatus Micrarchaeota archaeon]|nr:hypothetical protein [Candidatus Micrarchaeota archaeon]
MAANPDELLIFKMRGMGKKEKKEEKVTVKAEEVPKPMEAKPAPQPKVVVQPKPVAVEKPAAEKIYTPPKKTEQEEMIESILKKERAAAAPKPQPQLLAIVKKGEMSAQEQQEAAKGLTCAIHPWRPAYAVSALSKMPYCYADLVESNGKFYSLEDIDKVSGKREMTARPMNSFVKIASIMFILNAIIMGYFTAPQLGFIIGALTGINTSNALGSLGSSYTLPLFNLAISVLSFLAGILILLAEERGIYLSGLVGVIILVGASFEYLNSSEFYLLVVSIISLIDIVLLAYGRVSATTTSYASDIVAPDIEWPRVETF